MPLWRLWGERRGRGLIRETRLLYVYVSMVYDGERERSCVRRIFYFKGSGGGLPFGVFSLRPPCGSGESGGVGAEMSFAS